MIDFTISLLNCFNVLISGTTILTYLFGFIIVSFLILLISRLMR